MRPLSSAQVVLVTGVSYRRLDYWVRHGYVEPTVGASGSGTRRRWSDEDVARVREIDQAYRQAIAILRAAGLDVPGGLVDPDRLANHTPVI